MGRIRRGQGSGNEVAHLLKYILAAAVAQAQKLVAQSERGELTDEELTRKLNEL